MSDAYHNAPTSSFPPPIPIGASNVTHTLPLSYETWISNAKNASGRRKENERTDRGWIADLVEANAALAQEALAASRAATVAAERHD